MMRGIVESKLTDGVGNARVVSYELIDEQTVTFFRQSLMDLVDAGASEIELDMSQVNILSSMAICALITVDRKLRERGEGDGRGGRLRLRQVHPGSLEVFSYMRLDELLDIEPLSMDLIEV